jgi:hypothetical protein
MVTERLAPRRTGVSHLEHSEEVLSFARVATTSLHRRLPWETIVLYPTASERGGHARYALLGTRSAGGDRRPSDRLGAVPVGSSLTLAASRGPGLTHLSSPARKWRAMGRIEHTLLDGDGAPTDLRPSPAKRTIPQEVPNVSIYDKGPGYYVVLSRILQMDFGEFYTGEVRRISLLGSRVNRIRGCVRTGSTYRS